MPLPVDIADEVPLREVLGYLNFSSGTSDVAFLRGLSELWKAIQNSSVDQHEIHVVAQETLTRALAKLSATPAFQDATQAEHVLRLIFDAVLPAYRRHHRDLLFHQSEGELWQPFFIGRVAEVILAAGAPWNETDRIVTESLSRLNDFLGYRPVPVLETHKHEPYSHERVRPVPLYIAGAGVSNGKYRELIEQTLTIFRDANPDLLEAAGLDLEAMDELSFDPRAYDFNHPVNRRPNYHFGTWDPHLIDNKGQYRRFVIQQCTLDAILNRIQQSPDLPREQVLFEAGAVLAGTMLMASATTGSGPEAYDSSVSLATLLPKIARYRDEFYQQLFSQLQGEHRTRLEAEASARRQPFAGARQHLNAELARLRALQLQHVRLALIFSRLGFSEAALHQSQIVPAASARMVCQIQCLLAEGHRTAGANRLQEAFAILPQVEDLLQRAISCGAVIDPWSILGFGGQFSLFPAVENSIPDPRVDELLDLMEQIFGLYARLWHATATADDASLQKRIAAVFGKLAAWWDRFATTAVDGVRHISGNEAVAAAQQVANALAAWHKAGEAAGQVAFWRPHVEQFDSPQAYSRVIKVLLDQRDLQAAMALLMHWLSQAETVRLDENQYSFFELATRWLQTALEQGRAASTSKPVRSENKSKTEHSLMLKFFDHLEANAEEFWEVPQWQSGEHPGHAPPARTLEGSSNAPAEDLDENTDEDDLFGAAYENVVYRDSTADGTDADMLEVPGLADPPNDELEQELRRLSPRLSFLIMLATQWKIIAWSDSSQRPGSEISIPPEWLTRTQENRRQLLKLAAAIESHRVTISSASYEALLEYDRRRLTREMLLEKVTYALTATMEAEQILGASSLAAETGESAAEIHGPQSVVMISALMVGDAVAIRQHWGAFLAEVARQRLLYVPLARGGDAKSISAARALQLTFRTMLSRLPRLGLLRETCQLLRVARMMEKNSPLGAGAVTEFDRLFEVGYQAIVENLVESWLGWISDAARPPGVADDPTADVQLIDCLQQVTESLLSEWLSHSRTLRLSVLERVSSEKAWQELVKFIERYGHDLFTQQFFHLGNLRAILHQGVDAWLKNLTAKDENAENLLLVKELDHGLSRAEAKKHLSLVIEAAVENYAEYRDYNATTTQSDRGEMLYTLLDFLRIKVGYERIHWNLRPVTMAHEVLIRRGQSGAAELWRRAMVYRTSETADQQLARLTKLQTQYGMRLSTVADRLGERFVRPLVIDRVRALVKPAAEEVRRNEPPTTVALLEQEAGELADEPCGAGLDVPDWLELLEEEVESVCKPQRKWNSEEDLLPALPWVHLTWEEIQAQLSDWDTPPEISR